MRIETSSIDVGSSAMSTDGSTASARAIATRCRWPPDSSCGYFAAIRVGRHQPDRVEQLVHALFQLPVRDQTMDLQRPREVVADRLDRIQRAERVLEDHLHV